MEMKIIKDLIKQELNPRLIDLPGIDNIPGIRKIELFSIPFLTKGKIDFIAQTVTKEGCGSAPTVVKHFSSIEELIQIINENKWSN